MARIRRGRRGRVLGESPSGAAAPGEAGLPGEEYRAALDAAVRFLANRPRSEHEIRRRLARTAVPDDVVKRVLGQLRRWNLVDDAAFARYWAEQRHTFRPRGPRLLKAELRQHGVAADLAATTAEQAAATAGQDAYRVAARRAEQLASQRLDERTFRTRLAQLLARRGFDWDTIGPVVDRLWRETRPAA
jgi:regulatory protein